MRRLQPPPVAGLPEGVRETCRFLIYSSFRAVALTSIETAPCRACAPRTPLIMVTPPNN